MTATVGIDLASRPAGTAVCAIEWEGRPTVIALMRGVLGPTESAPLDDKQIASIMRGDHGIIPAETTKIAIDAPFGWPTDFARALDGTMSWPSVNVGVAPELIHRRTDDWIRKRTGKVPLSVTSDRIAYPAMRLAGLFAHYGEMRRDPVDRTGRTGRFCEAYPDPSITAFGLRATEGKRPPSYKRAGGIEARRRILAELAARAPWLAITGDQSEACIASDDTLDALICALVARAVEVGATHPIPDEFEDEARQEGWIHLPTEDALSRLR